MTMTTEYAERQCCHCPNLGSRIPLPPNIDPTDQAPPTPPPPKSHRAPPSCFPRTDDTPFSKVSLVIASTWTESPLIKIVLFWPDKRQLLPRFSLVISWGRNCVCHPPARQVAPIIPYMRTKLRSDPNHSTICPETTLSIQARIQKCQHF